MTRVRRPDGTRTAFAYATLTDDGRVWLEFGWRSNAYRADLARF
jgi:hypothetical protein